MNVADPTTDGRFLRSVRSRTAIVDAFLALVRAGNDHPSSSEIAARAGLTQRTLFNQFDDTSVLLRAAVDRQVAHVTAILPQPSGDGALQERVDRYIDGLRPILDEIAAVRWAVLTHPEATAELRRGIRRVREETRRRLEVLLLPELRCLGESEASELIDAAEIATDPMTWRLLRRQHGLSRSSAAAVMRRTLTALARDRGS